MQWRTWGVPIVAAMGFTLCSLLIFSVFFAKGPPAPQTPAQEEEDDPNSVPRGHTVAAPRRLYLPPIKLVKLSNGVIDVAVTRPDDPGAYHDSRFDWSGMIARVDYNKHWFFNGPEARLDDKTNYPVFGTAEEFGPEGALGFREAKPGETFIKIGVGELLKPKTPTRYWWGIPYEVVKPGQWTVNQGDSWIEYEQQIQGPRGMGYRYKKRIALEAGLPVIRISRTLANMGEATLATSHYCHNFVSIDDADLGPELRIELNYPLTPHPNSRYWRTRGIIDIDGSAMVFRKALEQGAVFVLLTSQPREAPDNWFRIAHSDTGSAVTIRGDRPVSRIALYLSNPTVCPEPFVNFEILPGGQESWETTYTFEADKSKPPATRPSPEDWRNVFLNVIGSTRPATKP